MSEDRERASDSNTWKLATFVLAGAVLALGAAGALFAYSSRQQQAAPEVMGATATAPPPASAMPPAPPGAATAAAPPAPAPQAQRTEPAPRSEPVQRAASQRPAPSDVESCNRYAASHRDRTTEAVKDGVIGGALGAALGAAGGAIAGGGSGAGKGAAIGGLVGVAGGSLFGINSANQANANAQAAYRDCMARRGYTYAAY